MIHRNDDCWCGSGKKWKKCHYPEEPRDPQTFSYNPNTLRKQGIILKTPEQIDGIRNASVITSLIVDELCRKAQKGVTTNELNDLANELHKKYNAIPAPLGYGSPPFPKSICTSLNEMICHGIPNDRPLEEGDILNIDASAKVNGYYGDCSRMVTIGTISAKKQRVVDTAYECLMESIKILKPGLPLKEIGDVIEAVAAANKCSVVDQFVGHGIGIHFHEGPQVFHSHNNSSLILLPGMTFTIEPMINAGSRKAVVDQTNKWEASTIDGEPSAQWEHTLLITQNGYEILTPWVR